MCLAIIHKEHTTAKLRKRLPKWFPVWKIIRKNDEPQFEGQRLTRGKIHKAMHYSFNRARISYKPGFHAFLDEREAGMALGAAIRVGGKSLILGKSHIFFVNFGPNQNGLPRAVNQI